MEYENNNLEAEITQCPNFESEEQIVAPVQTVADRVLPALKDGIFLAICILMSASCLISLSMDSIPLINILATVFLWLTYAQSRKDIVDAKHLRCVSGCSEDGCPMYAWCQKNLPETNPPANWDDPEE